MHEPKKILPWHQVKYSCCVLCRFVCSPVKPSRTPLRTPLATRTALMNVADPQQRQDFTKPVKPRFKLYETDEEPMKPVVAPAAKEVTTNPSSAVSDCHLVARDQLTEDELNSIYKTMTLNR